MDRRCRRQPLHETKHPRPSRDNRHMDFCYLGEFPLYRLLSSFQSRRGRLNAIDKVFPDRRRTYVSHFVRIHGVVKKLILRYYLYALLVAPTRCLIFQTKTRGLTVDYPEKCMYFFITPCSTVLASRSFRQTDNYSLNYLHSHGMASECRSDFMGSDEPKNLEELGVRR